MQFMIVCKLQSLRSIALMCDHNIFQTLQKCEQNLISFSFAVNMNEITNYTSITPSDKGLF